MSHAARMATAARADGNEAKARYWERIGRLVDAAPALTAPQRDQLAILLRAPAPAPPVATPRRHPARKAA